MDCATRRYRRMEKFFCSSVPALRHISSDREARADLLARDRSHQRDALPVNNLGHRHLYTWFPCHRPLTNVDRPSELPGAAGEERMASSNPLLRSFHSPSRLSRNPSLVVQPPSPLV